MTGDDKHRDDPKHGDLAGWIAGRRTEVERWVEVACKRAIVKVRTVAAEEIRGLSKRVDRTHELLDHLERIVESQQAGADEGEAARVAADSGQDSD